MTPQRLTIIAAFAAILLAPSIAAGAPAIRTSDENRVPACASTERLTSFLLDRNPGLNPRFRDIAHWYQHWGKAWGVRWDYAFFQMIVETNALKFRRADGRYGDVSPSQNNFAGIGTTGGGVPGNRFPDVKTGVHAQIQHLVAYSGERLAKPVAQRTALKQDDIIEVSLRLRRPVTFDDLARRWAVDRHYARTIESVAREFRSRYCGRRYVSADLQSAIAAPKPTPVVRRSVVADANALPPAHLGSAAAPEVLPWAKPKQAKIRANASQKAAAKPVTPSSEQKPGTGPVRTIWKRKTEAAPEHANFEKTAGANPEAIAQNPATQSDAESGPNLLPQLPHFRIKPAAVEPSRLGGPVPSKPGAKSSSPCTVLTASYGGDKTLLVRGLKDRKTVYTALTVHEGFESSMFDTYAKASAIKAEIIGEYPTQDAALAEARANCAQE